MRKLVKRYWWGGTSTWSPYTIPQNDASNTYMGYNGIPNYAEQLKGFSNKLNNNTDSFINAFAGAGDLFSLKLQTDKSNTRTMSDIKSIASLSSGSAADPAESGANKGKIGETAKNAMGAAGSMMSASYDAIPTLDKVHNENDETTANIRDTASKALLSGSLGPWGMVAGAALMAFNKTGGFTDASQGLGKKNDALNAAASLAIPGAGYFTKKTIDYDVSDILKQSGASYGGTLANATTAAQNAGAKILFGKSKANRMIANAKLQDIKVNDIVEENDLAMTASNNPLIGIGTQFRQSGGYQHNGVRSGKSGLKMNKDFAKRVVKLSKGKKSKVKDSTEDIQMQGVVEFKNGGAVNVIPSGALHKNKHHLENVDEKFEDVTTKGIPVITESEGGDITQHAEVEREEIIFNLDVTKQLEKLMEDGSDNAAIEAGKLLVHEILENTIDNAGILDKV